MPGDATQEGLGLQKSSVPRMSRLYYGDNLQIMQREMKLASVDLIYLDPPFNSQQNYNLIYKTMTGKPVPEQADAFCDTWEMDAIKEQVSKAMPVLLREHGVDQFYIEFWRLWMHALRDTQPHLLAYLTYMVQRLVYMKTILKPTGSIYLHCDPTASHYIKVMMDGIFGYKNFRNEIIWKRTGAHGRAKRWGPIHDTILFYSMSEKYTWNRVFEEYDQSYVDTFYRFTDDHGRYRLVTLDGPGVRSGSSGTPWRGVDPGTKGRHWEVPPDRALPNWFEHPARYAAMTVQERLDVLDAVGLIYWPKKVDGVPQYKRYLDVAEGNAVQDIVTDIPVIASHAKERLGYPTQKPVPLLRRIIESSSNPGDVVFDPFCGCGTTIYAAQETGRQWIGCDVAILAIKLIREILGERYRLAEGTHFEVDGIPASVEQAEELFKHDPYQFQHWCVEKVGGFPTQRKSSDRGIDGRLYFEVGKDFRSMVLSVKGGGIHPTDVRDLRGVLEREQDVEIAGFISLREPTKGMKAEASEAGTYKYQDIDYPRIQLLTVREILERKYEFKSPTKVGSRIATGQGVLALPER